MVGAVHLNRPGDCGQSLLSQSPLQQLGLHPCRLFQSELAIRVWGGDATLRSPFDVALHDQVRLVHFFERPSFFANRDCERIQTDGTATELVNQRFNDALVPLVEAVAVDLEIGRASCRERV